MQCLQPLQKPLSNRTLILLPALGYTSMFLIQERALADLEVHFILQSDGQDLHRVCVLARCGAVHIHHRR